MEGGDGAREVRGLNDVRIETWKVLKKSECIDLLQALVRTPSVNPPGDERGCGEHLRELFDKEGIDNSLVPIGDGRCNVVARLPATDSSSASGPLTLLYNGHLDTVPPGQSRWERDPYSGSIDGDRLYGLGACDMKAGVAAMSLAVVALNRLGLPLEGNLVMAATAGEESDSIGARKFFESEDFEDVSAAVIAEPTSLNVHMAEKGALWAEFVLEGRTAHGSRPDLGCNAIDGAAELLGLLRTFDLAPAEYPLLTPATLSINTIQGGVKTNVVPDRCAVSVDIRTLPGHDHHDLVQQLRQILEIALSRVRGLQGSINVTNDRMPMLTDQRDPLVLTALESLAAIGRTESEVRGQPAYTDASVFAQAQIPQIILGPGPEWMAHCPDEYTSIQQYLQAVDVFGALAASYLGYRE